MMKLELFLSGELCTKANDILHKKFMQRDFGILSPSS